MKETTVFFHTPDRKQWFALPEHFLLPAGEDVLHRLDGETARANLQALESLAMSQAEAEAAAEAQWRSAWDDARVAYQQWHHVKNGAATNAEPQGHAESVDAKAWADLVQGMLQESPDAADPSGEALAEKVKGWFASQEATETFETISDNLQQVASQLKTMGPQTDLSSLAKTLGKGLFEEQGKGDPEAEAEALKNKVRASIHASMRKAGIQVPEEE